MNVEENVVKIRKILLHYSRRHIGRRRRGVVERSKVRQCKAQVCSPSVVRVLPGDECVCCPWVILSCL